MPDPGVLISRSFAESLQQIEAEWRNGRFHAPPERVHRDPSPRPPIRGILLSKLDNEGSADCAFTSWDANTYTQSIAIEGLPTGGTFTLAFKGQTTAPIAWNATNLQVQTALQKLSTIKTNNVSVALGKQTYTNNATQVNTSEFPGLWLVKFQGTFANPDPKTGKIPAAPDLMTVVSSLTGLTAMTVQKTNWTDTGHVETVRPLIPVGTPSPLVAGAVVACVFVPGFGYGVVAAEGRQFAPGPF